MTAAPVVSAEIADEIRRHAYSFKSRHRECVGRLIVRKGIAIRYERLRNTAKKSGKFIVKGNRRKGAWNFPVWDGSLDDVVMVHSHPGYGRSSGSPVPSPADLKGASREWLNKPYAIFIMDALPYDWGVLPSGATDPQTGTLKFFKLHDDRKGFDPLA